MIEKMIRRFSVRRLATRMLGYQRVLPVRDFLCGLVHGHLGIQKKLRQHLIDQKKEWGNYYTNNYFPDYAP
jgi:hypothetical protein